MPTLLEQIEFRDPGRAREDLKNLGAALPERIHLLLASVPDPDEALHFLERFHREAPEFFERIVASGPALRYLITTFSYSRFLSEAVLRHPDWLIELTAAGDLDRARSAEELRTLLASEPDLLSPLCLARFRRRQLLRIMLRDVLGLATLSDITEEISALSDAILDLSYDRIYDQLCLRHGTPRYMDADMNSRPAGLTVISLGKLGGNELNYSSDIDLMFVYAGNGMTDGAQPMTNKEFFKKVANELTALLSTYTAEGMCYRVDLRLRPDGRLGEVCISLDGAKTYYQQRARDWELQMLIKARVSAGDRALGQELLEFVEPLIYSSSLDFRAVEAVSEARERISERLAARRSRRVGLDVKLARGGIRDIEFLVQCLQRLHGGREPWVRHGGTVFALFRLRDKGLLSTAEYARLASAYEFLRNLEHRLQFYDDRQTHTLPSNPEALEILARKMSAGTAMETLAADWLERQLEDHLSAVREIYERVIWAQKPMAAEIAAPHNGVQEYPPPAASNLTRFLDQLAPQLGATLGRLKLRRDKERFEYFLEKVVSNPQWLARLEPHPALAECAVDLFEHSRYFSDQLIRDPELLEQLRSTTDQTDLHLETKTIFDASALRRFFRKKMLRIQSESIFRCPPVFKTLECTSDLADAVIAAAYRIALAEAITANPPKSPGYAPQDQMMVIALGRLGMREFDLASDADLVFVIPDDDASEQLFWTGVAERIIHAISAYTGDGVMFTVDTRLRPNGREGALVQTESSYKLYFAQHAEAWEGISYMKARLVAGSGRASHFLNELQDVDWRRYGQSGRSRQQLAEMRARLEKEQGTRAPLKAGPGGYYDIDFALMYLRLKGAGIFFKVLNTPQRIDIIEKMGHLDREDADFLRDAATFYRAIDHGLRVSTGHAEGRLPTAPSQFEILTELVRRWTPEHLHDQPLDRKLSQIRENTHRFFDRVFRA